MNIKEKQLAYLENLGDSMLARINNRDPVTNHKLSDNLKLSEGDKNRLVGYYNNLRNDISKITSSKMSDSDFRQIFLKYAAYDLANFLQRGNKVPKEQSIKKAFEFLTITPLSPAEESIRKFFVGGAAKKKSIKKKCSPKKYRKSVKRPKSFVKATAKFPRKWDEDYCKKTSCKKMGFSQKASCRYYKNCYNKK